MPGSPATGHMPRTSKRHGTGSRTSTSSTSSTGASMTVPSPKLIAPGPSRSHGPRTSAYLPMRPRSCTTTYVSALQHREPRGCAGITDTRQTNGSEAWAQRVDGLSETILDEFFDNGALYELACEPRAGSCPSEVNFYKGLVHRWLAGTAQLAPFTADGILPKLATSAQAAIDQCTGGSSGRQCGFSWTGGRINPVEDDTSSSVGDQLSVLSAVFSLLVGEADAPIQSLRDRPSSGAGDDESDNETADETEESGGGSPEESATAPEGGSNGSLIEVSIVGVLAAFGSWILLSI